MFNLQYSPYAVPLAISALISIFLILYLYERRIALAAKPGMLTMVALLIWSAGYMLEFMGTDIATKLFWAKIQYFGIVGLPFAYFWFALEYSGRRAWLTRARLVAFSIIPIAILLLVFSNESHKLIWPAWHLEPRGGTLFLHLEHGIAFWINIIYTYILLIASTVLVIVTVMRRPELYRRQVAAILAGAFAPWIGNAISNLGLLTVPIDLTPFGFTITGLSVAWGIFRHNFINIAPIAHETVFENMSDPVFILDPQNIIVDINPEAQKVMNMSTDEIIGKHAKEAFTGQVELFDRFENIMKTREEITIPGNNRMYHYELSISPLIDRKNITIGRAIVLHDITDRKQASIILARARDEALQANQIKSQFLARISHELRTPLGVIRGYADLMSDPAYGTLSELQKKAVNEIIESNQRVSEMVGELLDEARFTEGAVQLENRPYSPADILNDARTKLSVLAKQKGLFLTTELDPELPHELMGDPTRIGQLLTNLTSNSIKFTQEGGVHIKLYRSSQRKWTVDVTDTGPGISEEAYENIFEPFRQADDTITRKYGGTGLGLSIVKHLTTLMDGEIRLESNVGSGSTFAITLPLIESTQVPK